jgi:hypothetical protein
MNHEPITPPGQEGVDLITTEASRAESQRTARGPSKTPLINREHVRAFLLDLAKRGRSHKWDRVSEQTLTRINEMVRSFCVHHVAKFPSKGKTL